MNDDKLDDCQLGWTAISLVAFFLIGAVAAAVLG